MRFVLTAEFIEFVWESRLSLLLILLYVDLVKLKRGKIPKFRGLHKEEMSIILKFYAYSWRSYRSDTFFCF